jgi:UDP-N-acetylglucosamine--N-acetylmuramyl-(pentapeptide) pyrophosphoryl-undecaprenol N-acetylglucosamine transferase
MYRIAIAAGGSGGHIFPGIAVAQKLETNAKVEKIIFIGRRGGLEEQIVPHYKFPFYNIKTSGLVGKNLFAKLKGGWQILTGLRRSLKILRQEDIHLVLGTGSYVSVPVVMAARRLCIPIVLQEQNAVPGKANRTLSRWAERICITYPSSIGYFPMGKCLLTGNPVRKEILALKKGETESEPFRILILGGSQGARTVNEAVCEAWPYLKRYQYKFKFIHQTGEKEFSKVKAIYEKEKIPGEIFPFIKDMASAYAQADLIIGRAGATTLAEITVLGLPGILIPYPWAMGHQLYNAMEMERTGASICVPQEKLTGKKLADILINLVKDKNRLELMVNASRALGKPEAPDQIASLCIQILKEKSYEIAVA